MSDFNQNLTVLTNVSKMPHTKFYENICTSFWVTMQRDSLRDMVMLMDNFPLQIIQKCMLTLWAVPPYIHGSRWPGPWGYCWWFMLVKVYILALHLRSIAITSLPDLVLIFDTKKNPHGEYRSICWLSKQNVEWMEFNSGIWWIWKWEFRYQNVYFWLSWVSEGLLFAVNCKFHDRCWCYCVGVGASWFRPGCTRMADKETALPQPSSTQWTGYQSSFVQPWLPNVSWRDCCKTDCEGCGQTQNRWHVGRWQWWASGNTWRSWTHWGTRTGMRSGTCWLRSSYVPHGKGKVHHRTGHEGPEGSRGIALVFL